MDDFEQEDADDRKRRMRLWIIGIAVTTVLIGGAGYLATRDSKPEPKKKAAPDVVMITPLPPPPPPPPPPPKVEPPPEPEKQEMVKEEPVEEEPPPEAPSDPSPDLGTNITGDGPGMAGLSAGGGGGNGSGGNGRGGKGGNPRRNYSFQLKKSLQLLLKQNPKTRSATMDVTVSLWVSSSGKIERCTVKGEAGPGVKQALETEILPEYTAPGGPPAGTPMPVVMSIKAARP